MFLGYDLLNEPIAPYFSNKDSLNIMLEPLFKEGSGEITKTDTNHIVILGAPQWNSNFDPFTDWSFDDKIMYSATVTEERQKQKPLLISLNSGIKQVCPCI